MQNSAFCFGGPAPAFDQASEKDSKMPNERVTFHSITMLPIYTDNERSQQISPSMLCWELFQQQNGYLLSNEELHQVNTDTPGPFVSPLLMDYSQYNRMNINRPAPFSIQPVRNSIGYPGIGR